jgi:toxin-antitoxin system PIN domain toxin
MVMFDVNVLVYAHRLDAKHHEEYAQWLRQTVESTEPFGLSDLVCSRFIRVVTNPRIFSPPATLKDGLGFIAELRARANCRVLLPGPSNWSLFQSLLEETQATAGLVADAYHAALAIEHGCELASADSDYARFPGLRWRHPLHSS